MASKKILDAKSLEALGARRLAELLIEVSTANVAVKRRIRLELASAQSPAVFAREIRKRLTIIARSRSFIDWQNQRTLIEDLEAQHRADRHVLDHKPPGYPRLLASARRSSPPNGHPAPPSVGMLDFHWTRGAVEII